MSSNNNRRKVGGPPYASYSPQTIQTCLKEIEENKLSEREASAKYNIPRSTIILKLKAIRDNKVNLPGCTCVFTQDEEESFVDV